MLFMDLKQFKAPVELIMLLVLLQVQHYDTNNVSVYMQLYIHTDVDSKYLITITSDDPSNIHTPTMNQITGECKLAIAIVDV